MNQQPAQQPVQQSIQQSEEIGANLTFLQVLKSTIAGALGVQSRCTRDARTRVCRCFTCRGSK